MTSDALSVVKHVGEVAGRKVRHLLLPRARSRRVVFVVFRRFGSVQVFWLGPHVRTGQPWGALAGAYPHGSRQAALAAVAGCGLPSDCIVVGVRRGVLRR
jgi:hypothetical protein